jgi:hypothetical protein
MNKNSVRKAQAGKLAAKMDKSWASDNDKQTASKVLDTREWQAVCCKQSSAHQDCRQTKDSRQTQDKPFAFAR